MKKDSFIKKNDPGIKNKKIIPVIAMTFFIMIFIGVASIQAQDSSQNNTFTSHSSLFGAEIDYLVPTRYSNKINTISIHAVFWKQHFKKISVLMNAGITASYAWGYSTQYYPITKFVWEAIDYPASAFGAGPVLQIEHAFIKTQYFSVIAEITGGFLLYDKKFPYGGDFYNFMLRTGPSFVYKINKRSFIKIGYIWMHVSNGQGYGNHNPFYEAQGINVGFLLMK